MTGSVSPAPCQGEESILWVIAGLAVFECLFPLAWAFPWGGWEVDRAGRSLSQCWGAGRVKVGYVWRDSPCPAPSQHLCQDPSTAPPPPALILSIILQFLPMPPPSFAPHCPWLPPCSDANEKPLWGSAGLHHLSISINSSALFPRSPRLTRSLGCYCPMLSPAHLRTLALALPQRLVPYLLQVLALDTVLLGVCTRASNTCYLPCPTCFSSQLITLQLPTHFTLCLLSSLEGQHLLVARAFHLASSLLDPCWPVHCK